MCRVEKPFEESREASCPVLRDLEKQGLVIKTTPSLCSWLSVRRSASETLERVISSANCCNAEAGFIPSVVERLRIICSVSLEHFLFEDALLFCKVSTD